MDRPLIFFAGLMAGICGTIMADRIVFREVAAAPAADVQKWRLKPAQPMKAPTPELRGQRCAPGFRQTPGSGGRYGCNRINAVRCPNGATPANVQLYRSGNDATAGARLLYECRMSETVRPQCARGFLPANLKLYRSGMAQGGSRLIYDCVRYRKGN